MEKWVFMIPITTFPLVLALIIAISLFLSQHYKASYLLHAQQRNTNMNQTAIQQGK